MKVYIDFEHKCHAVNDGFMTEVEDEFFDDKSAVFIDGYCYDDSNGYVHIYPWKPYSELYAAQREYERQKLIQLETYQNDLNTSYNEGINSI